MEWEHVVDNTIASREKLHPSYGVRYIAKEKEKQMHLKSRNGLPEHSAYTENVKDGGEYSKSFYGSLKMTRTQYNSMKGLRLTHVPSHDLKPSSNALPKLDFSTKDQVKKETSAKKLVA